jgi:hypothetical protein
MPSFCVESTYLCQCVISPFDYHLLKVQASYAVFSFVWPTSVLWFGLIFHWILFDSFGGAFKGM